MIQFQREMPINVAGHKITIISCIRLECDERNGLLAFVGYKRPVAAIIQGDNNEEIFAIDCGRENAAILRESYGDGFSNVCERGDLFK